MNKVDRDDELKNQTKYASVDTVFRDVYQQAQSIGVNSYLHSPRYKKLREKWIAVAYSTLVESFTNKNLYLRFPPPDQEPPDFKVAVMQKVDGKHDTASVEIVEANPHPIRQGQIKPLDHVLDRIRSKSEDAVKGRWPSHWQLCVYCNFTGRLNGADVHKALRKGLPPPFGQIWLIGANSKNLAGIYAWEVWPNNVFFKIEWPQQRTLPL